MIYCICNITLFSYNKKMLVLVLNIFLKTNYMNNWYSGMYYSERLVKKNFLTLLYFGTVKFMCFEKGITWLDSFKPLYYYHYNN